MSLDVHTQRANMVMETACNAGERTAWMDLLELKPGDRLRTAEGAMAEVVKKTQDDKCILVRYADVPDHPELNETEALCSEDELLEVVPKQ